MGGGDRRRAKVKGLAPLACKTDRIDAWVLAELSRRDLVPAIWLPTRVARRAERARWRLHLVRHRSALSTASTRRCSRSVCLPGLRPVRREGARAARAARVARAVARHCDRQPAMIDELDHQIAGTSASCARWAPITATSRC